MSRLANKEGHLRGTEHRRAKGKPLREMEEEGSVEPNKILAKVVVVVNRCNRLIASNMMNARKAVGKARRPTGEWCAATWSSIRCYPRTPSPTGRSHCLLLSVSVVEDLRVTTGKRLNDFPFTILQNVSVFSPLCASYQKKGILNNNKIQELRNGSFFGLSTLEKLELRSNMISRIEPGAFLGLPVLKRLDLSNNSIGCLNVDIFKGLTSLIKLRWYQLLAAGVWGNGGLCNDTGDKRRAARASAAFVCTCSRLISLAVITVRDYEIHDAPLELPSFQLTPSQRQVVFQGDSLPFQCQASFVAEDMQVLWYQNGRMVKPDAAQGIFIEKHMVQNCSLIASALTISNIQPGFTGNWECRVRTSRGNNTRTVHIVVLESSAKYCDPERVANNKGEFKWPRTLAGFRAYLPCNRLISSAGTYSGSPGEEQQAWRYCDRKGVWAEDDYTRCQFQKDVTRFLHVINQGL
ncbi:Adhesion G protein-coupled receptor A3 [Larimichthys crocea]|uniref:Uncharacterized protein n=1 Tax=Larimichthys crocea TaxID=215358 RepID=A0ACD3Q5D4_LARCR|nr:Adhesion G protein-coupled receptor A3 [Larimichthys crocea]